MRAERRPTSWPGPSTAQLLDAIGQPDEPQRLKWWQFEHVVGEMNDPTTGR